MSDGPNKAKPGIGKWFLKAFFSSPATWIGIAAGTASGAAFLDTGPVGGAIGFGVMVALAAGVGSKGILSAIRGFYANSHKDEEAVADAQDEQAEIVAELRAAGHDGDADVLGKMFGDRDAILTLCENRDLQVDVDAAHTLELVEAIVLSTVTEAEELQDLLRRAEDPLLDGPEGAEEMIAAIRERMRAAYQAVADARRRLRRGEQLREVDFLEEPEAALPNLDLAVLTDRLEEETAISRRVEERLRGERPDRADWMDDEVDEKDGLEESDSLESVSERLSESE